MKNVMFGMLFAIVMAVTMTFAASAVPPMISYQGKLMDSSGAPIADDSYPMQFSIYDVPTGGTALWSETQAGVVVKNGLFAVLIGSVNNLPASIFDSPDRYFGLTVGTDPEAAPRQKIASTAYAQTAGSAETAKVADNGTPVGGIIVNAG